MTGNKKIAFQGTLGAHSHVVCKKNFPEHEVVACTTFAEAFKLVENGDVDIAAIPIENSQAGRVAEVHNILPDTNLFICGEYIHPVRHALVGVKGAKLSDIKEVYSHHQAIMQCEDNIKKHEFDSHVFYDTAGAAKQVAEWADKTKAALASSIAADLYGLDIIEPDMQSKDGNNTLFLFLKRDPIIPDYEEGEKIITAISFRARNIAASLYKALGGFATNNINLIKLESYMHGTNEARFLVMFEGHPEDKATAMAIDELGFFSNNSKLLGVYYADEKRK